MKHLALALLTATTLLSPLRSSAAVPGGPGTGTGPSLPPIVPLPHTELGGGHDLGDHATVWTRELGIEPGQLLWFRWRTLSVSDIDAVFEVRDHADALVMDGLSSSAPDPAGYRLFSLSLNDLSGAPFRVRAQPRSSGGEPLAQWSNPVVLDTFDPGPPTCFTGAGLGLPIHDQLEQIRSQNGVPALAGGIVHPGGMSVFDAVGVRSLDSGVPVTPHDKWHMGSITKSMTATLAAILAQKYPFSVVAGTTIRDVFHDEAWFDELNEDFKDLTLKTLLAQHSGIVANPEAAIVQLEDANLSMIERRRGYTRYVGREPIWNAPIFFYHNGNFVIAAAMLEKIFGQTWEDLIQEHLFGPLGMDDTGFGSDVLDGESQPVGHWGETALAVSHGENPPGLGPAGLVHTTLVDLGKYVRLYLNGSEGAATLDPSTLDELLSPYPEGERYAWGWVNSEESTGLQLWHNGSNGNWYAEVMIRPDEGFGLMAATNANAVATDPVPRGMVAVGAAMAMLMEHQTGCPGVPGGGAFGSVGGSGGTSASASLQQPVSESARPLPVDVMPRRCGRALKPRARGKVKVAILSSEGFDATALDPDSLRLAGDLRPVRIKQRDLGGASLPQACTEPSREAVREARRKDGRKDLLLTFRRVDLLPLLEEADGAVPLTLRAVAPDGSTRIGSELVPVAPRR